MDSVALLDFSFYFFVLHVPLLAQRFRDGDPSVFLFASRRCSGRVGVRIHPAGYGMVALFGASTEGAMHSDISWTALASLFIPLFIKVISTEDCR